MTIELSILKNVIERLPVQQLLGYRTQFFRMLAEVSKKAALFFFSSCGFVGIFSHNPGTDFGHAVVHSAIDRDP